MPSIFDPSCGSGETMITMTGNAPYSVDPNSAWYKEEYFGLPDNGRYGYLYAPVTYTICLDDASIAKLFPAPVAPPSSGDSGLAIIVVFALIAQLVVNVIAIRKPTRSRS